MLSGGPGEGDALSGTPDPGPPVPTIVAADKTPPKMANNSTRTQSRTSTGTTLSVAGSRQNTKTSMEAMESVFQGRLTDLPSIPTNSVKVYICSTQSGETIYC